MANVLVIESSARNEGSVSRSLTSEFIKYWQELNPSDRIRVRDVAASALPHLDMNLLGGWMKPAEQQSELEKEADARSRELIAEVQAADVVVLASPMYNFGVPSTLKAWIDHVCRAGMTFRYTENGPLGLLENKRGIVISARGGMHAGSPNDHVEPYLRQVLNFIGISKVDCVHADGVNLGEEVASKAIAAARAALVAIPA